jgi:hypothetical protein
MIVMIIIMSSLIIIVVVSSGFVIIGASSLKESYQPSVGRNATVRSYIKAVIPINVSNVNVQELTRSSQIMSKILIKQALIEGVQRKIFEPHFEEH